MSLTKLLVAEGPNGSSINIYLIRETPNSDDWRAYFAVKDVADLFGMSLHNCYQITSEFKIEHSELRDLSPGKNTWFIEFGDFQRLMKDDSDLESALKDLMTKIEATIDIVLCKPSLEKQLEDQNKSLVRLITVERLEKPFCKSSIDVYLTREEPDSNDWWAHFAVKDVAHLIGMPMTSCRRVTRKLQTERPELRKLSPGKNWLFLEFGDFQRLMKDGFDIEWPDVTGALRDLVANIEATAGIVLCISLADEPSLEEQLETFRMLEESSRDQNKANLKIYKAKRMREVQSHINAARDFADKTLVKFKRYCEAKADIEIVKECAKFII